MQSPEISNPTTRPLEVARKVLETEIQGILAVSASLDKKFDLCVDFLYALRGRIIVTGVGKSGIIGRKIAATLTSTGSPAIFVHPVDGLHGDVGIVGRDDALIAISNSGETPEITSLVATVKKRGPAIVALTGGASSTLARVADFVLNCRVPKEACPLNMAPTASTTAALSLGDALAVALMIRRGFKKEDFLRHHPAGSLGERLNLKVRDMMLDRKSAPEVSKGDKIRDVIAEINKLNLGFTLVTESDTLLGIITDGDIRRALEHDDLILLRKASDLMTSNPLVITEDQTAAEALEIMERKLITALAVVQDSGKLSGIIHLHDLLGRGQIRFSQ